MYTDHMWQIINKYLFPLIQKVYFWMFSKNIILKAETSLFIKMFIEVLYLLTEKIGNNYKAPKERNCNKNSSTFT